MISGKLVQRKHVQRPQKREMSQFAVKVFLEKELGETCGNSGEEQTKGSQENAHYNCHKKLR
jgi:hypothetical protein